MKIGGNVVLAPESTNQEGSLQIVEEVNWLSKELLSWEPWIEQVSLKNTSLDLKELRDKLLKIEIILLCQNFDWENVENFYQTYGNIC